jgi:hypothetical protein
VQRQQQEASSSSSDGGDAAPPLSKKELKALQKKEEKLQAKLDKKKLAKKLAAAGEEEETDGDDETSALGVETAAAVGDDDEALSSDDGANNAQPEEEPEEITLEDKIRKERPPPRIRVMEGVQPGYTSLRLENVGITFRNQVVLKDVTWGVQTGDRIGLVGANGAGMLLYPSFPSCPYTEYVFTHNILDFFFRENDAVAHLGWRIGTNDGRCGQVEPGCESGHVATRVCR